MFSRIANTFGDFRSIKLLGVPPRSSDRVFVDADAIREALAQIPSREDDYSLYVDLEAVNVVLGDFAKTAVPLSPSIMEELGIKSIGQSGVNATSVGRFYIDTAVIYNLLQDNDCILGPDDGLIDAAVLDRELNNLDQEIII